MWCTNRDCPLNKVRVTEETSGVDLIVSFMANTHQSNVIYTEEQLDMISNEILVMQDKVMKCTEATKKHLQGSRANHAFEGLNIKMERASNEVNGRSGKTSSGNDDLSNIYSKTQSLDLTDSSDDGSDQVFSGQNSTGGYEASEDEYNPSSSISHSYTRQDGCNESSRYTQKNEKPCIYQLDHKKQDDKPRPSSGSAAYLGISLKDMYEKTGYIGLKKEVEMVKLSQCISRPLGCCYDEVRKMWAIADSGNNRVVLFPEGITIESPKFHNPATVCVLEPGEKLAILSDNSLAMYHYKEQTVSLIVEPSATGRLNCRGLARTPKGNLVTIQRVQNTSNVIIYDMSSSSKYGEVTTSIPLVKASNPSFCAMNENRLIITDLGNQSLTLLIFNDEETSADIYATGPRSWNDSNLEPNGCFNFVSGAQMDRNGWILIADAGGHHIQLFDDKLNFKTRLCTDFRLPYMSSICLNNAGNMITVDRQTNRVTMSKLQPFRNSTPLEKVRLKLPLGSYRTPNKSFPNFSGNTRKCYSESGNGYQERTLARGGFDEQQFNDYSRYNPGGFTGYRGTSFPRRGFH